jgi:hypothetical protein
MLQRAGGSGGGTGACAGTAGGGRRGARHRDGREPPPGGAMAVSSRAGWVLLAAGALALTGLVTWPLAACLGSCLGEPPDTLLSVYFLSWTAHALTTPGVRLLDASFFAPYGGTLALGDWMPAYALVTIPTTWLTGNPVVAHNVLLLASHTLAALGATHLAWTLTGRLAPALVAGVVFGYAPRLLDEAYNVQTLAVWLFPWLLLALERALERPGWGRAGLVAALWLGLALASLNVFVYATVLAGLFVLAAGTWGGRPLGRGQLLHLGGAGTAALGLVIWVVLAPNRALVREWGLTRDLAEVERYSATLADVVGVPRERLLRHLAGLPAESDHTGLTPGLVVLVLVTTGLVLILRDRAGLGRRLLPYVLLWAAALILALGPTLYTAWGAWPLPYRVLYAAVPGFSASRTPFRFLVFAELGTALLAAVGAARWLAAARPRARGWLVAALLLLILAESVPVPYPGAVPRLDPARVPAVYRWLATQPPETIALGIPIGDWVNVAAAAFHLRRTLNGWSSYLPPHYPALVDAMARFPDARSLALARGAGVDLVLVDRAWLGPGRAAALAAVSDVLRPERAFPTHLVYRLVGGPPSLEPLEVRASVRPASADGPAPVCVTLANPGPGFAPLYPLHRLHLVVERGGTRRDGRPWLPIGLAPGTTHAVCLPWPGPGSGLRVRGEIEGGARAYRFALAADGAPQRLQPAASP